MDKNKSVEKIMEEIELTRQQIGSVNMILDGAQVHVMVESLVEALKVIAELFVTCKATSPRDWNNVLGSQEDSLKSARELGLTTISTLKTFMEALPDNLRDFEKKITPELLDVIESYFRKA
jgi:hypothetical protein